MVVVGAGGNVGGAAVRSLARAGIPVRAAGTRPARLRVPADVETVKLDLLDPTTFVEAVRGAAAVFLVRPPAISKVGPTLNAFLDVAWENGVEHVVFSSVTGADTNKVVPHHRVETHLRASGRSWTILRPGFFAQNLADAYRDDVVTRDRIVLPAGQGRAAFIDVRDVGDVAAHVLADPAAHRGAAYTLTGPQALRFTEVAAILSDELGRTITYEPTSALRYLRHVRRQGRPSAQALVQTVLHAGLRRGQAETVDPTLERLLGRSGRTLTEYVHEHRDLWAARA
ncbi:NmrA family NAD(P)-binding protein [Cellulomonas fimi]|uniref:NmrA family protein n=1 Tax=Cellulomonas fimi (strain ATCC 484 / DSM 20113 / JCM 1341 / CCUG 24087 / LMG 16345 / NBRC 15513 / NCIMB 8980 / NCTC 7547 / NRS-133) TaxID=590998 RepID=F4H0T6_CELFA|nr:NmrA family NAD(P)-binding protein [Cellulomonas fimi]AEE46183.1 NmrA family protein [Cellulomonas fimi ATCC 484]NNH07028.1 NmrA family NAD(P)-binding protein [Cellulomonas fimi]VEH31966.1 NAD(P)H azoreductase [Cellulomonas fimi]